MDIGVRIRPSIGDSFVGEETGMMGRTEEA